MVPSLDVCTEGMHSEKTLWPLGCFDESVI
jgi:hypothetical protein